MKRTSLLLPLALALSVTALPAQADPSPRGAGPAELLRYVGDPVSATGSAISNGPCDVNGDRRDDAVVGAWGWDKGVNNVGAAYVVLGDDSARGGSLGDPSGVGAVRIDGYQEGDATATSVACLGDVNGDSYDDIGIGDWVNNRAFVIFGAEEFTGLTLNALGDRGFIVKENFTDDAKSNFSTSLSAVGDINNDGFADFAVAAVVADTQDRSKNGKIWIIAGRDDISDVNVSDPAAGDVLLSVDGALNGERLGAIAQAGDVNGDGVDDFVLGSYTSTPWGASAVLPGAAYVVFGGRTGNVDLLNLGDNGFKIFGPQRQRDRLGTSVSSAGDVDGDGLDDLLIGGDGVSTTTTGPRNGGAAVVLGSASTATVYTDPVATHGESVFTCPADETPATCATPTRRGYWINGAVAGDSTAYSAAGIGDVNADGVPDFALGAYGFDPVNPADATATMSGAGATYVVYGKTSGTVQELSALTDADGFRIDGLKAGDRFGRQVGLIGDFDGNGVRDLAVGADQIAQTDSTRSGLVAISLMGELTTSTTLAGPTTVSPGREATFTAAVTKNAGVQAPVGDGTVSFSVAGSTIEGCSAVPVTGGSATCAAMFAKEVSGDVVATFSGSSTLQSSEAAAAFAVVAGNAVIEPGAVPKLTYGTRPAAITGEIRGDGDLTTGTVELRQGAAVLARANLAFGEYALSIGAKALVPGSHALTLVYSGDAKNRGAERSIAVSVAKAKAKIGVSRSRGTLKGGQRLTVKITVAAKGVAPAGKVKVKIGSKVVKTLTLKNGKARYKMAKFTSKGTKKVTVVYSGSGTVAGGTKTVKVVQK